jgi:DNA polymerase-3 subunit alpha
MEGDNDSDDEDSDESSTKKRSVKYFKMASALAKIRQEGVNIEKPDINKSNYTFRPSIEENKIYFGLKGITGIGDDYIQSIMLNRPFSGLDDFVRKVKSSKPQIANLIKAGAFDSFGDRFKMLDSYCESVADVKVNLTLQNMGGLTKLNLFPEEMKQWVDFWKIHKHIKKFFVFGDIVVPDENMMGYIRPYGMPFEVSFEDNKAVEFISLGAWENFYQKKVAPHLRNYIVKNQETLLQQVNTAAIKEIKDKYMKGTLPDWEMASLSYYYTQHLLTLPDYQDALESWGVVDFFSLPEEPEVEWTNGQATKMRLYHIAGTSIGREKNKCIVGLLTPSGFLNIKIYKSTFNKFDKQLKDETGTEKSWFSKGQVLLLQGYRIGDEFKVKTYKGAGPMIKKIMGPHELVSERKEID